MRIALDQVAQFTDSIVLRAQVNQGKSLRQLCRRSFATAGKVLPHLIVILYRLLKVPLLVLNLGEIEVGVPGKIGIGIEFDVVGEFLDGKVILVAIVIAQPIVVDNVSRRGLRLRLLLSLLLRLTVRKTLL